MSPMVEMWIRSHAHHLKYTNVRQIYDIHEQYDATIEKAMDAFGNVELAEQEDADEAFAADGGKLLR